MVTTLHDKTMAPSGKVKQGMLVLKPKGVLDYNRYMGGVDHLNQMSTSYVQENQLNAGSALASHSFVEL